MYLANASSMPLVEYALQMYNGHLMPGEFLVMWIITAIAPLDYTVPLALTAVFSALVVGIWGRALSHIAGERRWLLVPLVLISLSPLLIRPTIWWASALQVLPMQACLAWGVLVAARMATRPTRRGTVELVVALAVALFFWQKAVLLLLPFFMVLVSAKGGALLDRIRLHRAPILALTLLAGGYSALYLALGRQGSDQREKGINFSSPPSLKDSLEFMSSGLGNLLAPGTLGGPWGSMPTVSHAYSVATPAVNIATSALLAVTVVAVLVTRRGAWVPLAVGAVYTLVSWALVLFSSRFVNLGTIAINDERYSVDCFTVVLLALTLGIAGPARTRVPTAFQAGPFSRALAVAIPGALLVSLVLGNVLAVQRIGIAPAKPWVDAMTRELEARDNVTLVESTAPDRVLAPSYWLEYAKASRMLSPLEHVSFTDPAPQLHVVSDTGQLEPVVVNEDARSDPGPVEGCGYTVQPGSVVIVPLNRELFAWNWVLRVDTFAAEGGTMVIDLGAQERTLEVSSGLQSVALPYSGEVSKEISVAIDGGTVCLTSLVVGNPKPAA